MLRRFSAFLTTLLSLTSYHLFSAIPALAVAIDPPTGKGGSFSNAYPTITGIISSLLKNSIAIAGTILIGLLIFGGVSYIMSAGENDPKKQAQAQAMITDAVIGFLVVALAYIIVQLIEFVSGVNILNPTF